jgi:hypothetical protein
MTIVNYVTRPPKYQAKYHTVAHRFLDLERTYVFIPDESYQLLDQIITEVKSQTHYDPNVTDPAKRSEQLLGIFQTIDLVLVQDNFIFPPVYWTSTLGEALQDHQLSSSEMQTALAQPHNTRRAWQMKNHSDENFHLMACEPAAFLYMGVAEALGFELKPVLLPQHIFVRAALDKDHWINWDPNRGRSISDDEYVRDWGVEDWQIKQKIYMQSLSSDQTDAQMFVAVGVRLGNSEIWKDRAIECYRKAIELCPRETYANSNLALCLLFTPDPDSGVKEEALELAQRAVNTNPDDPGPHLALAYVWAAQGQTAAAVREVNKAIELDPQDSGARFMLPFIQSGDTMYGAFKSQSPILCWTWYEHGWLYTAIVLPAAALGAIIYWVRRRMTRKAWSNPPELSALAAMAQ